MVKVTIQSPELYCEAREKLLNALTSITVPKIARSRTTASGKYISQRDSVIGNIGRTQNFGFGQARAKGYCTMVSTLKHPEVMKALVEFGNLAVPPGFFYNMITLNHGVKAKKHTDGKNVGDSVIVGIGNYTGGALRLYDSETTYTTYSIKDAPLIFNGSQIAHETEDFEGDRYTIIYYKQGRGDPVPGYTTVGGALQPEPTELRDTPTCGEDSS